MWFLACCIGAVAAAQDRIATNPKPDAQLKKLFPEAAKFSPLQGRPLHFVAYGPNRKSDPTATPLGYAFWTTDLVPKEHGYQGPIHILVGMNLSGILTGVVVDYHSEPYGYFSIQLPEFAAQFKGKNIRDRFVLGRDVDAVSRASITVGSATRAIRDSSRIIARVLLDPNQAR